MTTKKYLLLFLGVLAIKDLMLGSFLLFNLKWLVNLAGLNYSEDVMVASSFFGVCVLIVATLCIAAILFVANNKPGGIFMSKFIGIWMMLAAVIIFFKIGKPAWSAIDFLTGILITIPAFMYGGQTNDNV